MTGVSGVLGRPRANSELERGGNDLQVFVADPESISVPTGKARG